MDFEGPWGCKTDNPGHLELILTKLRDFESMAWNELQAPGRHTTVTCIPVESMCSQAQRRLQEIEMDDVADLWELHLGGRERIWGIRAEGFFEFVWWDPRHEVCPSRKKHT